MSKTSFRIAFDGPSVTSGEIDVHDLAPALLALGDVVQAANHALNNDRARANLKVTATKTRRSSMRCAPDSLVGRCGPITARASSLSQKTPFVIIFHHGFACRESDLMMVFNGLIGF